ncbi:hypothetical protein [Photobacterium nomapromontoriensis]|uniref:hypothetical protein n=1 Tax=Photobacterium nomapromontoriensis TaxID=2910237 RepID=UPI003D13C65F
MANQYIHDLTLQQQQLLLLLNQIEQKKLRINTAYQVLLSQLNTNEEMIELAFTAAGTCEALSPSLFTHKVAAGLALKKQITHQRNCLCKTQQNIEKFKQHIQSTRILISSIINANRGGSQPICVHLELKAHQLHTSNAVLIALHQRILFAK